MQVGAVEVKAQVIRAKTAAMLVLEPIAAHGRGMVRGGALIHASCKMEMVDMVAQDGDEKSDALQVYIGLAMAM